MVRSSSSESHDNKHRGDIEEALLRLKEVLKIIPVSKVTFYQRIKEGLYPAPLKSGRCSFWRKSDIQGIIANMVKAN